MNENNFTEIYKSWTTEDLLDIVDNSNEYQPTAVKTARIELNSRQLSAQQLEVAKTIQSDRQKAKARKQQKIKAVEDKIKSVGFSLIETFNPIQKEPLTTDKQIKLISLFLCGLFLYELYKEFGMLNFMFTNSSANWDFSTVLYFIPFFLLPTAGILFWFRRKLGWALAVIFFSYTAVGAIPILLMELNRKPTGFAVLDNISPATSPLIYIGTFAIFGRLTWIICKKDIREIYQVDKKVMFTALGIGTGFILLLTISLS